MDGVGYGSAMIANKVEGYTQRYARTPSAPPLARQRNNANVLCIGGKIIGSAIAMEIVKTFMHTDPLTADKYSRRRDKSRRHQRRTVRTRQVRFK